MKKRILLLLLMAVFFSGNVSAQKGMQGIGVSVPIGRIFGFEDSPRYGFHYFGGWYAGAGVQYYYNFSDYVRIKPSIEYSWASPSYCFRGLIDLNLFLASLHRVRPYFIAGAGAFVESRERTRGSDIDSFNSNGLGVDSGLGFDCRLSHTLSMQLEGTAAVRQSEEGRKYNWAFVGRLGLTYNF